MRAKTISFLSKYWFLTDFPALLSLLNPSDNRRTSVIYTFVRLSDSRSPHKKTYVPTLKGSVRPQYAPTSPQTRPSSAGQFPGTSKIQKTKLNENLSFQAIHTVHLLFAGLSDTQQTEATQRHGEATNRPPLRPGHQFNPWIHSVLVKRYDHS